VLVQSLGLLGMTARAAVIYSSFVQVVTLTATAKQILLTMRYWLHTGCIGRAAYMTGAAALTSTTAKQLTRSTFWKFCSTGRRAGKVSNLNVGLLSKSKCFDLPLLSILNLY